MSGVLMTGSTSLAVDDLGVLCVVWLLICDTW